MELTPSHYTLDPGAPDAATRFATGAAGRRVVLKRLENDCLIAGQIHPNIKERLHRVRELPVTHLADLLDVERIDGHAWLVWSYLEGMTLDAWYAAAGPDEAARRRVLDEAALVIENLHAHGIVHGAVHPRNVIVDAFGNVALTHVSPYLYDDRAVDHAGAQRLREELKIPPDGPTPRELRENEESKPIRSRARWLAVVFALIGAAVAVMVWWSLRAAGELP